MRNIIVFIFSLILIITFAVAACNSDKSSSANNKEIEPARMTKDSLIKRGEYLVTIMGCNDCHSPKKMGPNGPEPDQERLLSGHPSNMPLGKINPKELESWVLFHPNQTATAGPWAFLLPLTLHPMKQVLAIGQRCSFLRLSEKVNIRVLKVGGSFCRQCPGQIFQKQRMKI